MKNGTQSRVCVATPVFQIFTVQSDNDMYRFHFEVPAGELRQWRKRRRRKGGGWRSCQIQIDEIV